MSSQNLLMEMDFLVVKFLLKHGGLPAVVKNVDERIQEAENRLANRLIRQQIGLETALIQALRQRGLISGSRDEQLAIIRQILSEPFEEMASTIAEDSIQAAAIGREMAFADVLAQGLQLQLTNFSETVANQLRERHYVFSQETFERIMGDFANTLQTAYQDGIGINETATRLRADFKDLRDNRLRLIARTEIQGSQNEAINSTMRELNIEYKQWLTVGDSRVRGRDSTDRYDHVSLHGQVVRKDEPFSNGLMHPLDRSGPIGDWINCRCRMRPYIPKKGEIILTTPYYPAA